MAVAIGTPMWTTGHFTRIAAQDDLGLEDTGSAFLRRLIPGVVANTPNAAYYGFYPFLVREWQRQHPQSRRSEFKVFYRRQEAALAFGASVHDPHRGPLRGLNGSDIAGRAAIAADRDGVVDLDELAGRYMESPYGGYGLFYRAALEAIGLTVQGSGDHIDHVTPLGEGVADAVEVVATATRYWREYRERGAPPFDVLAEFGAALCPCNLPGRADQDALLEVFVGDNGEVGNARSYRIMSFGLFLEFHAQRPPGNATIAEFRGALASGHFAEGSTWMTSFLDHREAWRAYQLREIQAVALSAIWVAFLRQLQELSRASLSATRQTLLASIPWDVAGVEPKTPLGEAMAQIQARTTDARALVDIGSRLERARGDDLGSAVADAFFTIAGVQGHLVGDDDFQFLLGEGGNARWSVRFVREWLGARRDEPVRQAVESLITDLYFLHVRVANSKIRETDRADPFCISDDGGILRVIRTDEPFWADGRFATVNHLLWTLGALTAPGGDIRLTDLGVSLLDRIKADV